MRLIFYRLFSKKKFWKTISLSHSALSSSNLGKNILFCSFSVSHNKLSHFVSSLCFFSLLTPSLSSLLTSSLPTDSLSICRSSLFFSLFLLPSTTPFFNKFFFFFLFLFSPHRLVNDSITIFGIFIKLFVLD